MKPYADVSINLAQIDKSYHYLVPKELGEALQPGCLVAVPFGKQVVQGVVLNLLDERVAADSGCAIRRYDPDRNADEPGEVDGRGMVRTIGSLH